MNPEIRADMMIRAQLDECEKRCSLERSKYDGAMRRVEMLEAMYPALIQARTIMRRFAALAPSLNGDPRTAIVTRQLMSGELVNIEAQHFQAAADWLETFGRVP